ncbi:MAG: hypothetical protein PHP03_00705 [Candidatus Pacebacteria bacterium]|nr:hypothetical protein [Candidatus Paceibacterota bacterium]
MKVRRKYLGLTIFMALVMVAIVVVFIATIFHKYPFQFLALMICVLLTIYVFFIRRGHLSSGCPSKKEALEFLKGVRRGNEA